MKLILRGGWTLVFGLWSKSKVARSRFVLLERKPPSTPSFSSFSSIVDSGVDTAF